MRVLYDKIPEPRHRYIHHVGDGFLIGASGGTVYHFIRALRRGGGLTGGARAVRANVPRVAGEFGACGALFWAIEIAISGRVRRREDGWSLIAAGAASVAVLNGRKSAPVVAGCAVLGAAAIAAPMGFCWIFDEWHNRSMLYRDHRLFLLATSESEGVAPRSTTPGVSAGLLPLHFRANEETTVRLFFHRDSSKLRYSLGLIHSLLCYHVLKKDYFTYRSFVVFSYL